MKKKAKKVKKSNTVKKTSKKKLSKDGVVVKTQLLEEGVFEITVDFGQ